MKSTIIRHLLNLFPSTTSEQPNLSETDLNYSVKIAKGNKYLYINWNSEKIILKREENFSETDRDLVVDIIQTIDNFNKLVINEYYYDDIIERSIDIGVMKYIFKDGYEKYLSLYNNLIQWKDRTYENKYVCFGIEIDFNETSKNININDVIREDFIAPIGDGISTYLKVDRNLNFIGYATYLNEEENSLLPIRFSTIVERSQSIFIILTRQGDLLLIKDGELKFSKKGKYWIHYNHENFIKRLTATVKIQNHELKRKVYESCLDVSFSKTGGIIAILRGKSGYTKPTYTPEEYKNNPSLKYKEDFLNAIIYKKKFFNTDRLIRKELLGIDGSLIIDASGDYHGIGIITKVPGGSVGGGRTAAAVALSKYGLAIKISSDGYIQLFRDGNKKEILKIL